ALRRDTRRRYGVRAAASACARLHPVVLLLGQQQLLPGLHWSGARPFGFAGWGVAGGGLVPGPPFPAAAQSLTGLDAVLLEQPDVAQIPKVSIGRSSLADPSWLATLEALHAAAPRPGVLFADGLVVAAAVGIGGGSRSDAGIAAVAFVTLGALSRLYRPRSSLETQGTAWYARLLAVPVLGIVAALSLSGERQPQALFLPAAVTAILLVLVRTAAWVALAAARRRTVGLRDALVVGSPANIRQITRRIAGFPEAGLRVAATYAPSDTNGGHTRARTLLEEGLVSEIIVTAEAHSDGVLDELAQLSEGGGVECALALPVGPGSRGAVSRIGDLGVVPLGLLVPVRRRMWTKRLFDLLMSAVLLILLAP